MDRRSFFGASVIGTAGLVASGQALAAQETGQIKAFANVAEMKVSTELAVGDYVVTKGYQKVGDEGHAKYSIVSKDQKQANEDDYHYEQIGSGDLFAQLINDGLLNVRQFGAVHNGESSDTNAIQQAINIGNGKTIYFPAGIYLLSNEQENVLPYRNSGVTAKVGLLLKSNTTLVGAGEQTVLRVAENSNMCAIAAHNEINISIENLKIDGNASYQTSNNLVEFGIYLLNCKNIFLDDLWVTNTKSNTLELIGCKIVSHGKSYHYTSYSNGSQGGGPQFEDCSKVSGGEIFGDTYDDLVSIISHNDNSSDMSFSYIEGRSQTARALFIGQSKDASTNFIVTNISAKVNAYECGFPNDTGSSFSGGETGAFVIRGAAKFNNIDVNLIDRASYMSVRITPYSSNTSGELKNCKFTVLSYNARTLAFELRHDAQSLVEHNKLDIQCVNPNQSDSGTYQAVLIRGGSYWDIDVNINYPEGKNYVGNGILLGQVNNIDSKVSHSSISGIINGGNPNLILLNTDNVILDKLTLTNPENGSSVNAEIRESAINTSLGAITKDGVINNLSESTKALIFENSQTGLI